MEYRAHAESWNREHGDGDAVPFHLYPVLGGSTTLRGYREFRWRDKNALLLNVEYVWEVSRVLDAVAFYDLGRVFARASEVDGFGSLHDSWGGGFRFKSGNGVHMRIEVGRSDEGTRIWVKFSNVF